MSMRATAALLVGIAALSVMLTGCSKDAGETTCTDFIAQSSSDQSDTVDAYLKDHGEKDPKFMKITAAGTAMKAYCKASGNGDRKINEMTDPESIMKDFGN